MGRQKRGLLNGDDNHAYGALFFAIKFFKEIDKIIIEPDKTKADAYIKKKNGDIISTQIKSSRKGKIEDTINKGINEVTNDFADDEIYSSSEVIYIIVNNKGIWNNAVLDIDAQGESGEFIILTFEDEKKLKDFFIQKYTEESSDIIEIRVMDELFKIFYLYILKVRKEEKEIEIDPNWVKEGMLITSIRYYLRNELDALGLTDNIEDIFGGYDNPFYSDCVKYIYQTMSGNIKINQIDFKTKLPRIEKQLKELILRGSEVYITIKRRLDEN